MDIVVRDLDSGEETVVFDDGGYVVLTSVSHDESSVAVTALSLQPQRHRGLARRPARHPAR